MYYEDASIIIKFGNVHKAEINTLLKCHKVMFNVRAINPLGSPYQRYEVLDLRPSIYLNTLATILRAKLTYHWRQQNRTH